MSVRLNWSDPKDVEAFLDAEGLGDIDTINGFSAEVSAAISPSKHTIKIKKSGCDIDFYFKGKLVGCIQYFEEDEYLHFIGNINGLSDLARFVNNSKIEVLEGVEIAGLGKFMLEVFFSDFVKKGTKVKMSIENPKIRTILQKLKVNGKIKNFYDINGVYTETIVEV